MLNIVNVPGNNTREITSIFLALNWKLWTHSIIRFLRRISGISFRSIAPAGMMGAPSIRRISGSWKLVYENDIQNLLGADISIRREFVYIICLIISVLWLLLDIVLLQQPCCILFHSGLLNYSLVRSNTHA